MVALHATTENSMKTVPFPTHLKLSKSANFNRIVINIIKCMYLHGHCCKGTKSSRCTSNCTSCIKVKNDINKPLNCIFITRCIVAFMWDVVVDGKC